MELLTYYDKSVYNCCIDDGLSVNCINHYIHSYHTSLLMFSISNCSEEYKNELKICDRALSDIEQFVNNSSDARNLIIACEMHKDSCDFLKLRYWIL